MFDWLEQLLAEIFGWQKPPALSKPVQPLPQPTPMPPPKPEPKPVTPIVEKKKAPTTIKGVAELMCWCDTETGVNERMTAMNIENWILENIEYEFHWYPQGIKPTWEAKSGDCTDRAMLAQKMLEYNDIDSELWHGYANGGKHDYLKTKDYSLFTSGYDTLEDVGRGLW